MMRFGSRPNDGRLEFEGRAAAHQRAIAALTRADGSPDHAQINEYIATKRNQIWGDVKPYFMATQNRKCGFCEVKITESTGDVEHYRPKNAVWSLQSPGGESEDLVNVHGRRYRESYDSGYWWLAYSWDNYLVACPTCNQKWKSALFPIAQRRRRRPKPGDEGAETPLLIDPFGEIEPSQHLAFGTLGQIEAHERSSLGRKTIETCGLDRESLRSSREEKAIRAHRLVRQLAASTSDAETLRILNDLREMGNAQYAHSGMVRAIFEQATGMKWETLAGP